MCRESSQSPGTSTRYPIDGHPVGGDDIEGLMELLRTCVKPYVHSEFRHQTLGRPNRLEDRDMLGHDL